MNGKWENIRVMIKKSIPDSQHNCFDGSCLFMEEYCSDTRAVCMKSVNDNFTEVKTTLNKVVEKLDELRKDLGYG